MKVYTFHAAYQIFSILSCVFTVVFLPFTVHRTVQINTVLWAAFSERLRTGFSVWQRPCKGKQSYALGF